MNKYIYDDKTGLWYELQDDYYKVKSRNIVKILTYKLAYAIN